MNNAYQVKPATIALAFGSKLAALSLLVLGSGCTSVNVVSMPPVTFTVPFFIEQVTSGPTVSVLRADFTLPKPAVLESINMLCFGATDAILYVDGGPLGTNGVTGVGSTADVGLNVGISGLQTPFNLTMTLKPNGDYYLPVTHIGAPVKSAFTFILFPDTTAPGVQCFVTTVFRSLS